MVTEIEMQPIEKVLDIREDVAEMQHEVWSRWMDYLFKVSLPNQDGTYTIPQDKVQRWQRQMETSYQKLTEPEKESDREVADIVLSAISL